MREATAYFICVTRHFLHPLAFCLCFGLLLIKVPDIPFSDECVDRIVINMESLDRFLIYPFTFLT